MSRPIVYVALQQFCADDARPLRLLVEAGFDVRRSTLGRRLRREEMAEQLRDAHAVIAGIEPYDAAVLQQLPKLRCISRCGVGLDAIDLDEARRRGIAVVRTAEEVIEPVAQMTVAMVLALARNLPQHAYDARQGRWNKRTGVLLAEWTIGLVGFGRIGRRVEQLLRAFGPRIMMTDPNVVPPDVPASVARRTLAELLAESDVVSLHADSRREAGPLIGAAELALMKPGSFLVNTARGHLVDEPALVAALRSGHLAGAALDVFDPEPYTGALATLPQALCTPHVSTLTRASRVAMELRAAQQVVDYFASQPAAAARVGR